MRICLLTPGQPSINPRLVKEADALHEVGYEVHVLCSHYIPWADEADNALLATRSWSCTYVGGDPKKERAAYYWTRARHALSRRALRILPSSLFLKRRALVRVLPELETAALRTNADLYIAHYAGGLAAAALAARIHCAHLGFDAEDLESASYPPDRSPSSHDLLLQDVEARYLPQCAYLTASSPGIADDYAARYGLRRPMTILNVFPLAQRPASLRLPSLDRPLMLYWFSQTIGLDRGLRDAVLAVGMLRGCRIELHVRGALRKHTGEELFALAHSSGVDVGRLVIHEPAPQEEMVRLAAQYDIGLAIEPGFSRNNELAISNKIFTYLLAGNAVAASSTAGHKVVMDRIGEACFCYPAGNAEALARGLRSWYEDRAALRRARERAWDWGTREYNWDFEKKKFLVLIESTLQSRRARPFIGPQAVSTH
jgi:hypothetical protein